MYSVFINVIILISRNKVGSTTFFYSGRKKVSSKQKLIRLRLFRSSGLQFNPQIYILLELFAPLAHSHFVHSPIFCSALNVVTDYDAGLDRTRLSLARDEWQERLTRMIMAIRILATCHQVNCEKCHGSAPSDSHSRAMFEFSRAQPRQRDLRRSIRLNRGYLIKMDVNIALMTRQRSRFGQDIIRK